MEDNIHNRCHENIRIANRCQGLLKPGEMKDQSDMQKIRHITTKMNGILKKQAVGDSIFKYAGCRSYQGMEYA
ncbi:hypothetical protein [Methanolobus sp.]|uniref:hypothetical protein n=1 Tax=Methanolobus sp. TaxID=1874737 RepID=UPI0025DAAB27|nr:hypothetical protein [Methanolobus sp.]